MVSPNKHRSPSHGKGPPEGRSPSALHLEEQRRTYGDDQFPYGLAANRDALATLASFCVEQGLITAAPDVAELFAPSTRGT